MGPRSWAQALGQATVRICVQRAKEVPGSQGHKRLGASWMSEGRRWHPRVPAHSQPSSAIAAWTQSVSPRHRLRLSGLAVSFVLSTRILEKSERAAVFIPQGTLGHLFWWSSTACHALNEISVSLRIGSPRQRPALRRHGSQGGVSACAAPMQTLRSARANVRMPCWGHCEFGPGIS